MKRSKLVSYINYHDKLLKEAEKSLEIYNPFLEFKYQCLLILKREIAKGNHKKNIIYISINITGMKDILLHQCREWITFIGLKGQILPLKFVKFAKDRKMVGPYIAVITIRPGYSDQLLDPFIEEIKIAMEIHVIKEIVQIKRIILDKLMNLENNEWSVDIENKHIKDIARWMLEFKINYRFDNETLFIRIPKLR